MAGLRNKRRTTGSSLLHAHGKIGKDFWYFYGASSLWNVKDLVGLWWSESGTRSFGRKCSPACSRYEAGRSSHRGPQGCETESSCMLMPQLAMNASNPRRAWPSSELLWHRSYK